MFPASTTLSLQPMCETSQTFQMFLPQIQLEHPKTYFKLLSSHWSQQPATFPNAGNLLVWCRSCPRLPVLLRQTPQLHNDKRASKGRPWLHNGNETVIWLTVWGKLWHFQKKQSFNIFLKPWKLFLQRLDWQDWKNCFGVNTVNLDPMFGEIVSRCFQFLQERDGGF